MSLKLDLTQYQNTDEGGNASVATPSLKLDLSMYAKPMEAKTEAITETKPNENYIEGYNKKIDEQMGQSVAPKIEEPKPQEKQQSVVQKEGIFTPETIKNIGKEQSIAPQIEKPISDITSQTEEQKPTVEKPIVDEESNLLNRQLTFEKAKEDSPIKRFLKTIGESLNIIDTPEEIAAKQEAQYKVEKELKNMGLSVDSKDIEKNFTEYKRIAFPEVSYDPTKMEVAEGLMKSGLIATIVMNPESIPVVLKGLGTFAAVSEGINLGVSKLNKEQYNFAAGKGLQDIEAFKKRNINPEFLQFADLLVKMGITGAFGKVYKNLFWEKVQEAQLKDSSFIDSTKLTDKIGKTEIFNKSVINGDKGQKLIITQDKNGIKAKLYIKETTLENLVDKLRNKKTATGEKINPFTLVQNDLSQSMSKALGNKPIQANIVQDGIEFILPTTAKPILESVSNIDLTKSPITNENIQGGMISPLKTENSNIQKAIADKEEYLGRKLTQKEIENVALEQKQISEDSKNLNVDTYESRIEREKNIKLASEQFKKLFRTSDDGTIEFDTEKPEAQKIISEMFGDKYSQDFFKTYDKAIIDNNKIALGFYANDFINLFENGEKVSSRATYHESYHKFFNTMLTNNEQKVLLNKYGDEEKMARDFEEFVIKEKIGKQKMTLGGRIRVLFEKLFNSIKNFLTGRKKLEDYFKKLLKGEYKEKEISKGITETPKNKGITFEEFEKAKKEGFTAEEEGKSRREALDEIYKQKSPSEQTSKEKRQNKISDLKETKKTIATKVDEYITPVSWRIKDISEKIFYKMKKSKFDAVMETKRYGERISSFINSLIKNYNSKDYENFDLAMINGDREMQDKLSEKLGIKKDMDNFRIVMDDLFEKQINAGLNVKYRQDYFPRQVKAGKLNEFIRVLDKRTGGAGTDIITEIEKKYGRKLNNTEKLTIINDLLNKRYSPDTIIKGTSFMKAREIDLVDKELRKYYEPTPVAIANYIKNTVDAIYRAKLLGNDIRLNMKSEYYDRINEDMSLEEKNKIKAEIDKEYGDRIKGTLAYDMMEMLENGELTSQREEALREMLFSIYNPILINRTLSTWKNIQNIFLLTKFTNTLTQATEIKNSLIENGLINTLNGILRMSIGKGLKAKDVGITNLEEDLKIDVVKGKTTVNNILETLYKLSGFKIADLGMKDVFNNADYIKIKKLVAKKDKEIFKEIYTIFGDEAGQIIDDINSGKMTDDIKFLIYAKLSEYQPLDELELPEQYLKGGSLKKLLYQYKFYGLKQLSNLRYTAFRDIRNGITGKAGKGNNWKSFMKGMKKIAKILFWGYITKETVNYIKDLMLDKKHDPKNAIADTLSEYTFLNRYITGVARDEGIAMAAFKMFSPSTAPFDNIIKDIEGIITNKYMGEIVKNMPLIGDILYWNLGGGTKKTISNKYVKPSKSRKKSRRR